LQRLQEALFDSNAEDELEPLVPRYREAATALSARGGVCARSCEASTTGFLRENEAAVQARLLHSESLLELATLRLKILDPELGEEELIKSVAAERAKLRW
jgi:hypothetical protein